MSARASRIVRVLVAIAAAIVLLCATRRALAFHAGDVFQKPAGAGGGGGIFYTGAPLERGWTCAACHLDAEHRIRITLDAEPKSLFETFRYAPGQTYTLTAKMQNEHLGHDAAQANFNALSVSALDAKGNPAGTIDAPPDDFYASGAATIASAGQRPGQTSWTFTWTAPPAGAGVVTFHVGAVDGNGADQKGSGTLTDPFGDDVYVGALALDEGGSTAMRTNDVRARAREGAAMKKLLGVMLVALAGAGASAGCGEAATKDDPCPRGICTGGSGGGGGGGGDGGASGGGDAGCAESWSCTAWQKDAQGNYTRTCTDTAKCGTSANKPSEGPIKLPELDMDFYKCKVEPIFDRGCSMLGCHGTESGRLFKVYARGRLRKDEMVPALPSCNQTQPQNLAMMGTGTTMCQGWWPHTTAEWQENFDGARAFMVGLSDPEQSELLTQPKVGGKNHTGVHLFASADPDYQTLKSWLGGAKLGAACDPAPN